MLACAMTVFNRSSSLPLFFRAKSPTTLSGFFPANSFSTARYRSTTPFKTEQARAQRPPSTSGNAGSQSFAMRLFTVSSTGSWYPSNSKLVLAMASSSASLAVSAASPSPGSRTTLKSPPNCEIFFTLFGSLRVRVPKRSPAPITAPPAFSCEIVPLSPAIRGITIFIASTSANGFPATTSPPSSCRYRISFPVTSVRNSLGSNWLGNSQVWPSRIMRKPSGSSSPSISCVRPPQIPRSTPSERSRIRASIKSAPPFMLSTRESGPRRFTSNVYFTSWYVMSMENVMSLSTPCVAVWPFCQNSLNAASSACTALNARHIAADATIVCGSSFIAIDFSLMIPSSHAVSMVLFLKSSVSRSCTRYSTAVLISPLTTMPFRAMTRDLRASSRVLPVAKMCPNCESANSCTPPFAPTLKYPHTSGVLWKDTRSIPPLVGLNPSSGFSAVILAAMRWRSGRT
mmetsp:Transcript_1996/g.7696  ORF Transcript_1996/g.7696 Transcript_1996/m.7696 type:complete len:457 (+) Transcript_1996:3685-5055(+)